MSTATETRPEVIAAITAAVQQMTDNKVIAVRVKRSNNEWAQSARGGRNG